VPSLDASASTAALLLADLPTDAEAERKATGQEELHDPLELQQVDSAEATEDIEEAYPISVGLTSASTARTDAGFVMTNCRVSNDGATASGNGRPSMMMYIPSGTQARSIRCTEVWVVVARCPISSRAKETGIRSKGGRRRNRRPHQESHSQKNVP
jgi:hypothetical protein